MKLTRKGSKFYAVKRVPKRYSSVESRKQVWISLKTDSLSEARVRAYEAVRDLEHQWVAKLAGECDDIQRWDALSAISASRGFPYLSAEQLAQQTLSEILRRVTVARENETVAAAVLGAAQPNKLRLSQVKDLYLELMAADVKQKGPDQRRVWENTLNRSVSRLLDVIGDKYLDELTREDALMFRQHWSNRLSNDGLSPASANRELTCISGIMSKLHKLKGLGDQTIFRGLTFTNKKHTRPPYEEEFIRHEILPVLDQGGLNSEAAAILKILINTGMRPSEVTGLIACDIHLDGIRDFPDGFSRYRNKTSTLGQTVKKFLVSNDLRPTPGHCVYSFRHGFQDRLSCMTPCGPSGYPSQCR